MKFTLVGYYGFGNLGDEAILESIIEDLRRHFHEPAFQIISADYCETLSGTDITRVPWTDWPRVIESVRDCDWLLVGGGGLFNCYLPYPIEDFLRRSDNFAAFIFGLPVLAFLLGKRSCIYGVGASRFNSEEALEHARMAVRVTDLCSVRDRSSSKILCTNAFDRMRISVHADPAFRLVNAPLPERALADAGITKGEPVVGVVLRNWSFGTDSASWEPAVAAVLRTFALRHSVRLLFIPFQASSDLTGDLSNDPAVISRMRSTIGQECTAELRHGLAPGQVSSILARCQMVVAMRLHASILAIRNATPFVALDYDSKVSRVMGESGLERFVVPLPQDGGERLTEIMETVWADREHIQKLLQTVSRQLAIDAGRHAERLASIVRKPRTRRKIDGKTADFLARIVRDQTLNLARSETARDDAVDEAQSCRRGIRELVDAGMFEPALHMLRAWKVAPEKVRGEREYLIGYCMHALRLETVTALQHYAAALKWGFDEFWVRYSRGQLLLTCGEYSAGIADLERACILRPDVGDARRVLVEWAARDGTKDGESVD